METPIAALLRFCLPAEFWWKACIIPFTPELTGSSTFKSRYDTALALSGVSLEYLMKFEISYLSVIEPGKRGTGCKVQGTG
jgi:hypothetical protein